MHSVKQFISDMWDFIMKPNEDKTEIEYKELLYRANTLLLYTQAKVLSDYWERYMVNRSDNESIK